MESRNNAEACRTASQRLASVHQAAQCAFLACSAMPRLQQACTCAHARHLISAPEHADRLQGEFMALRMYSDALSRGTMVPYPELEDLEERLQDLQERTALDRCPADAGEWRGMHYNGFLC